MSTSPQQTNAITVENVSKSFKLPHEQSSGIKQLLINRIKGRKGYETQQVLEDISFSVKQGEFFGIVGRNGSGKSTLLKLLANIYVPDAGNIRINGSLTPFIELGVGFNPELTGKENVYLNGALLGFSREEMNEMYNDIVSFAELKRFMDQKLKNYSSGMQVRLAFSIAIRANTDILILDEVLAVGDEAFQKKCIAVFERYKKQKKTIILVTHDMSVVERFCDRAVFVDKGRIKSIGKPRHIAALYSNENLASVDTAKPETKVDSRLKIKTYNTDNKQTNKFTEGDDMVVRLKWDAQGVQYAGVAITRESGEVIYGPNTFNENNLIASGESQLDYTLKLTLAPGEYYLQAAVFGESDADVIVRVLEGPHVIVLKDESSSRYVGISKLEHSWKKVEQPTK